MKLKSLLFLGVFTSGFASLAQPCLVSNYPFNGNALDAQGVNNGTVFGGATLVPDRFGNANSAYSFDGIDDYIEVNEVFDTPEKTVCLWFNAAVFPTTTYGTIFTMDNPTLVHGNMAAVVLSSGGINYLRLAAGGIPANIIDVPVNPNQWYHLAMVKRTTGYEYYLDCNSLGTFSAANESSTNGDAVTRFGTARVLVADRFFTGKIDSISITDCGLTDAQVCAKYTGVNDMHSNNSQFKVYPNPTAAGNYLNYEGLEDGAATLTVYNTLGEAVYTVETVRTSGNIYLNPAVFTSGMYYVRLQQGEKITSVQKFTVK